MKVAHKKKRNPLSTLPLNLHSLPLWHQTPKRKLRIWQGNRSCRIGCRGAWSVTNYEVSSSDSELSGWPSEDRHGSEAVWVYRAGAGTESVVATIGAVTVAWAWKTPRVGGSVDATDKGTVSVVAAPDTGRTAFSEVEIPEVVTKVVYEGVGCPVSLL
jgi:hypothetical protein